MLLLLIFSSLLPLSVSLDIFANTSYGILRGRKVIASNGKEVSIFKSVRFAKPPLGKLRFEKAEFPEPWQGIQDALNIGPSCMWNTSLAKPDPYVSEDCLFMNIFAGTNCMKTACPVVVYLHGGGINVGSIFKFDDHHLIDNFGSADVVLVIPAYRLGFFGLLTFSSDEVVPRVLAIHDNIHALNYVQQEIGNFGGDPTKVTLMGHSSGGGMVSFIVTSPALNINMSLFQQAIIMSPDLRLLEPSTLEFQSWKLVEKLKCGVDTKTHRQDASYIRKVVDCLKAVSGQELLNAQRKLEYQLIRPTDIIAASPLATREDQLLSKHNPIKVLIGTCLKEHDATLPLPFDDSIPLPFANKDEVLKKIKKDIKTRNFPHKIRSQPIFVSAYLYANIIRKSGGEAYLYSIKLPKHPYHTDDLCFIMGIHCFDMDKDEKELSKIYPQLITDFIKTGRPHKDWKTLEMGLDNFYSIEYNTSIEQKPRMLNFYERETLDYWFDELVKYDQKISK